MPSLTAFTVCLSMSSRETQGTPISYVTSGSNNGNELVIEIREGYFNLLIDDEGR